MLSYRILPQQKALLGPAREPQSYPRSRLASAGSEQGHSKELVGLPIASLEIAQPFNSTDCITIPLV